MSNIRDNKIKPEQVKGTIPLGSVTKINIGKNAVKTNESAKPSEEFIESLEKGAKEEVFPTTLSDQNGS